MSILSWLRTVSASAASGELAYEQPMVFAEGEEDFRGLNMREALDAHIAWTHRLEAKLKGRSDESLRAEQVAADNRCTLGEWIYGEARARFGGLSEYEELRSTHAAFHEKAAEIVAMVQDGGEDENVHGRLKEMRRMSGEVQLALVRLYARQEG